MPVTTRSKSKRLLSSIPKDAGLYLSKTSPLNNPLQNLEVQSKRPSRVQSRQQPSKQLHKYQDSNQEKPSEGSTNIHSPDLSSTIITHFPCLYCDCPQGVFKSLINSCINCGDEMEDHRLGDRTEWNSYCPYLCERQDLVSSILQYAINMGKVVIRATPLVGKTTLLKLLGYHILLHNPELEPVFVLWQSRNSRNNLTFQKFLDEKADWAREDNAKYRPYNPTARMIYLIDEAQGSYEEENFWNNDLKSRNTRSRPIYVLVCLWDAIGLSRIQEPYVESQASKVDTIYRIDLRPSKSNSLCMLFRPEETLTTVSKWIIDNRLEPESIDRVGIAEYLHSATDGHPGMVGLILGCFELLISQNIQNTRIWSPAFCHEFLVEHDFLVEFLGYHGRGVWTIKGENNLKNYLTNFPPCNNLKYSDVINAMRKVAILPQGYTEQRSDGSNALAFCYKMGFLHAEPSEPGSSEITYIFASPIHRRIAYRRLIPGLPLDLNSNKLTLQQTCLNAIERFSPSVLHHRSPSSNGNRQFNNNWGIPEAVFQDEMYCCLNYELHNLPILTEYSETKDGRIDFYIFDKKWGIEILQSGNNGKLKEHTNRFRAGGKYYKWGIFEDYIVLNFCSKSSIDALKVQDIDIQSHVLHIVIDANECTAKVYTYNKQLQVILNLGEGRQRLNSTETSESDTYISLRDQKIEVEEMRRKEQEMQQEKQEMQQEMERKEQEKQEMERQILQLQLQLSQR